MSTPVNIKVTSAKAWVAAAGTVVSALATGLAAVQLAVEDGSLGVDEIGSVATALAAVAATIYGVWRAPRYTTDEPYVAAAEGAAGSGLAGPGAYQRELDL